MIMKLAGCVSMDEHRKIALSVSVFQRNRHNIVTSADCVFYIIFSGSLVNGHAS